MTDAAANAAQIAYWNEGAGPTWAALQVQLDRQIGPLGRAAALALGPKPGERILDIGCGCGESSLELARAVGPTGEVTGLDISRPMLEIARARAAEASLTQASFVEADAQAHPFAVGQADAVYSRFGVMFFADPTAAFANIRKGLKPGGRLAFVCWRAMAQNPIMTLPLASAAHLLPPTAPPEPGAPGPFAFADQARTSGILGAAGFTDIVFTPHNQKIGSGDLETTLGLSLRIGPLGGMLREHPDKREAVIDAVRAALRPHEGPDGVLLDSATWIVTARNRGFGSLQGEVSLDPGFFDPLPDSELGK
ncbi:class I SAM-dependent methyltransferase [Phenylobacterium aquaticum]|uniref:class I SAM-dependent methyltransferase n=1 Tax=Phenylobacterium aquaticum TaxID=1763816 RepID=UPI0026EB1813|nr:methyltransferase domain-containing protein [Phenylobacterium aquaticum]